MPSSFAIFFGIALTIIGLMHFVVYKSLISIFLIQNPQILTALRFTLVILSISFIAASLISGRYNNFFTRTLYSISAFWVGLLFYLFIAAFVYALACALFGMINPEYSTLIIGKLLIFVALAVSIYGVVNANNIVVTEYVVSIPNLPSSWKDRKAVFISDLHLGQIHGKKFANKINTKIENINPDIIFDTGDLYDGVKVDAKDIISTLKFKPKLGTYFVSGNHEEYGDTASFIKAIRDSGSIVLNDQTIEVEGVIIAGADYPTTIKKDEFQRVIKGWNIDTSKPTILLKHVPLALDIAEDAGIDLELSGHTHKAQIWPLSFITKYIYKGYDYGLNNFGAMQQLTTSGVGTWGPPLRIGSKAEIVLITFK